MGAMKLHIVLLFVFVTRGLVRSAPVDAKEPNAVSLEPIVLSQNELNSTKSKPKIKKSVTVLKTQDEVNGANVEAVVQESINPESGEISCPLERALQDLPSPGNMEMNPNLEPISSEWNNQRPRTYYEVDYLTNSDRSPVGVGNYGGVLYPFVHPNIFAARSPVSTVSYLPPVYSPRVYDLSLDAKAFSRYDMSGIKTSNVMPKNVRSVRTSDEDFMAELAHDAMMNNIIPTMPVPFVRDAGYHQPQVYRTPVTAVFPQRAGGCAIPILLSCSPEISRGSFNSDYSGKHELPTPYNVAYRFHEADQIDNGLNHDGIDISFKR